jgi:hypothetical protein
MVRAVDSSLLDEWERMLSQPERALAAAVAPPEPVEPDITRDERGFTVLVRNALFQCVKALARRDYGAAAAIFVAGVGEDAWNAARFELSLLPFFEEHGALRVDPTARSPQNTRVTKPAPGRWEIVQVLCDPEGDDDWVLTATVDLEASARQGHAVLAMRGIGR